MLLLGFWILDRGDFRIADDLPGNLVHSTLLEMFELQGLDDAS